MKPQAQAALWRGGRVRLKATVSKTVMGHWPIESSNLSLSALTFLKGGGARTVHVKVSTPPFHLAAGGVIESGSNCLEHHVQRGCGAGSFED